MNAKRQYLLNNSQKSIWFTEKFYPDIGFANIALLSYLGTDYDFEIVEKAINRVLLFNEGLRLRMLEQDGEVKQYVHEFKSYKLNYLDLNSSSLDNVDLDKWAKEETRKPFKLIDSDLFFFTLIETKEGYILYVKMHHLITDAWGIALAINEISDYCTLSYDESVIKNVKRYSYIDAITKEQKYLNSNKFLTDKKFWTDKFKTIPESTILKKGEMKISKITANRKTYMFSKFLTHQIKKVCNENSASVYTFFLATLLLQLAKLTSKEDIVVGTVFHNRAGAKEKKMAGMFISTVPFRFEISKGWSFLYMLKEVSTELLSVLRHQKYPYTQLLSDLRQRDSSVKGLFDVFLSYQNVVFNKREEWIHNGYETTPIAFHISDRQESGELKLEVDYQVDLFEENEIDTLVKCFVTLVNEVTLNPENTLQSFEILGEEEKKYLLLECNNTAVDYQRDKCIHTLFEEQVNKSPNKIALTFDGENLTYKELDAKANKLAGLLRSKGISSQSIIGVMMMRSFDMLIAILAILKAGAGYLPIDPGYPSERIKYMLEDSGASILLTQMGLDIEKKYLEEVILINEDFYSNLSEEKLVNISKPTDIAYIIYTSGSTGKPKGVVIEHRSFINFIKGVTDRISFTQENSILAITTICFDIFTLETLLPLTCGSRVVISNEHQQTDPQKLNDLIQSENIDMIQMTPSRIQMMLASGYVNSLKNVNDIMIGGEAFPEQLLKDISKITGARIHNMYGPTETTVWSTIKTLKADSRVTIGTPIANTRTYIMNSHYNLLPIGFSGELYIGGDGLARGYHNRKELNEEKFVVDPFYKGEKMYRTGDIARWLPNGEIECQGRTDHQVKVRGYRIELLEIENALNKKDEVYVSAATVWKDEKQANYIAVYYVSDEEIPENELRGFLIKSLPEYSMPAYFVRLDEIPQTQNGKINRNALPKMDSNRDKDREIVTPQNETENTILKIWREVLKLEKISVLDNFFSLGGDSIKAIQIVSMLQKLKNNFLTRELYTYPTIRGLSSYVDKTKEEKNQKLKTKQREEKNKIEEMEDIFRILEKNFEA